MTDPYYGVPHTRDTPPPEDVDLEPAGVGWTWVFQTRGGGFYRGTAYKTKAAARKAGREWLKNRQDPRKRGR